MLQQRLLISFLLGDIFADTRRSDYITGCGSQQRVLPTNQPAFARTRQDLILMMPREGLPHENARKEFPQAVNLWGYEEFDPVLPDHVQTFPARQLQKVIIAIGDAAAHVERHADSLGVAK